ncbi:FtsK/SpoIIIE domain-containing protein [Isoptericola hypogeus]
MSVTSGVPALVVPPSGAEGAPSDDGVRVTVHPAEDVLLPAGAPLGALRAGLAALLRRPELRHAPLTADGVPVADADVVGHRPLLPGVTLAVAREVGDPVEDVVRDAVLRRPWLVARADGVDAGVVTGLRPGVPTTLPASPGAASGTGPTIVVRTRSRRPDRVHVRTRSGAARLVRTTAGGRRRVARVGRLPRRWRPGSRLEAAGARYTLHASGEVGRWLAPPAPAERTEPTGHGAGIAAAAVVPVVGSLVLAAALRQPVYALFSLVGVLALVPQLLAARRRRRARAAPGGQDDGGPVAATATNAAPPGSEPGRVLARVVAAHEASDGAWRRAVQHDRTGARAPGRTSGDGDGSPLGALVPDGALAVRGPRDAARAVARAVVVDIAAAGASVTVLGAGRDAWSWCRWLPETGPRAVVVDAADDLGAEHRGAPVPRPGDPLGPDRVDVVVLCLPVDAAPPSWCRTVWEVRDDGLVQRRAPDGTAAAEPLVGVSAGWAEGFARRVAGLAALRRELTSLAAADGTGAGAGGRRARPGVLGAPGADDRVAVDPTDPRLPSEVSLAELLAADLPATGSRGLTHGAARAAVHAWDASEGWAVPLGVDADGRTVRLDLVGDGPHLLVAGTTGSGKSELLQALVLGLASRRSPRDLALALVDFKGGASFGPCSALPHVVGQVTDLDAGLAGRALAGLRAELHRRERLLADRGAADLAALAGHPDAPPRLVVVIDEFRALADDLPEFLPGLLRVAAQGRSLGVHLVLATQRPAGAVSADVRANVSARVALRVVDAADSHDVVDTGAAARIRPGTPGRAVLRLGAADPVALQCAHAGTAPSAGPVVRRAPAWRAAGYPPALPPSDLTDRPDEPGRPSEPQRPGAAERLVAALREEASRRGLAAGPAPWLPPLPERVTAAEAASLVPAGSDPAATTLPLALGDDPARQCRRLVSWSPADGHLAVVGTARSGRTTTLVALARTALGGGWHVHALAPRAGRDAFAPLTRHPGFGTLAGPDDPRRAARLLRLLAAHEPAPGAAPVLVVVDAVEQLRAALAGPDPWDPLAAALAGRGTAFAVAADGATVGGLAPRVGPRLVLLGRDPHADVVLGAPSPLAGSGGPPGRGAWLGGDAALCQVLLPGTGPVPVPATEAGTETGTDRPGPVVVRPLPVVVRAATLPAPARETVVVLGAGGDAAEPVSLDVAGGALVSGPRGSGRSSVLRLVARRLASAGRLAGVVSRDADLRAEAGVAPAAVPAPAAVRRLLDDLAPGVLVVDDLDLLAQTCPVEAELVAGLLGPGGHDVGGRVLVASATTTGALLAHRGALAELRATRTGVVLHPGERGADDVLATPLGETAEPGPPRPGRGALVASGRARPVQVALP